MNKNLTFVIFIDFADGFGGTSRRQPIRVQGGHAPVTASSHVDGGTAGAASPVASECTRVEVRAQAAEPVRANVQARVNTTAGA